MLWQKVYLISHKKHFIKNFMGICELSTVSPPLAPAPPPSFVLENHRFLPNFVSYWTEIKNCIKNIPITP